MNKSYTILLADDDPDDQELIFLAFSKVSPDFQLHIVKNGREVIDFLSGSTDGKLPCLIILDYNMPEMNGAQVLQNLNGKNRYSKIPKVVLSTSNNPKYVEDCLVKGADAYRVKPDSFSQLIVIAKEMLTMCNKPN